MIKPLLFLIHRVFNTFSERKDWPFGKFLLVWISFVFPQNDEKFDFWPWKWGVDLYTRSTYTRVNTVCKFRVGRPSDRIRCLCCWYCISSYAWEVLQPWYSSSQAQYGSTLSSFLASISAVVGKSISGSDYPRQAEFESQDPGMSMLLQRECINPTELCGSGKWHGCCNLSAHCLQEWK